MICATISIDLLFSVASIFFSTSLPARQQGLAGAISNVLLQFGIPVSMALADTVATATSHQGQRQSYKNAFWFNVGYGATAMVIFMGFVRISRAKSDYTADEREEQQKKEVIPEAQERPT